VFDAPVELTAVDAMPRVLEQVFEARSAPSSVFVGAAPSITMIVTRCSARPSAVWAVIRYVPA